MINANFSCFKISANHVRKIPSGRKDWNALEFAQYKEIMIARDQEIGFAGMGRIEKFVHQPAKRAAITDGRIGLPRGTL